MPVDELVVYLRELRARSEKLGPGSPLLGGMDFVMKHVADLLAAKGLNPPLKVWQQGQHIWFGIYPPPWGMAEANLIFKKWIVVGDVDGSRLRVKANVDWSQLRSVALEQIDSWIRWAEGPGLAEKATEATKKKAGRPRVTSADLEESKRWVYFWKLASQLGVERLVFCTTHEEVIGPSLDAHERRLGRAGITTADLEAKAVALAGDLLASARQSNIDNVLAMDKFDDVKEAGVEACDVERILFSSRQK